MQAIYNSPGNMLDYTPSVDTAAGTVVVRGDLVGITKNFIPASVKGALAAEGEFTVVKATGAIDTGDAVYWDADGNPVGGTAGTGAATTTDTSNKMMGIAIADAASGDATVKVKLVAAAHVTVVEAGE